MASDKKKTGEEGEQAAVNHLKSLGWQILERNTHIGHDEIDIIAKDGDTLVFVEVKTRATDSYGVPEDFITSQKEACMVRAAESYIFEKEWDGDSRFDVIAVHYAGRKPEIRHFPDAFYPLP